MVRKINRPCPAARAALPNIHSFEKPRFFISGIAEHPCSGFQGGCVWDSFGEDWDAVIAMEVAMGLRGIGANPLSRRGSGASLTPSQPTDRLPFQQENSLRYGELTVRPAFSDDEARQVAWVLHRDRLLQHCSGGKRPAGWWDYDSPVPYPRDPDYAEATLYEAELLVESEVTELMARWRSEFERAQDPGFMFCAGAIWLKGEAARKAHLKWAGVPRALIRKWTSQRRRRSRTVRKLVELAPAEQPVPAA
jgi:hypothetical protein